jgi:hypothetical protein
MTGGSSGPLLDPEAAAAASEGGAGPRRSSVLGGRLSMSASRLPVPAGGSKLPVPSRRTSSIHAFAGGRASLLPSLKEGALGSPPGDPPPPPPPESGATRRPSVLTQPWASGDLLGPEAGDNWGQVA